MKHMNIETLMDILDWFDDGLYDQQRHTLNNPHGAGYMFSALFRLGHDPQRASCIWTITCGPSAKNTSLPATMVYHFPHQHTGGRRALK